MEKSWSCIKMAKEYPTCIFPDILDLVSDPPKKDNWVPANLKLVNAASCVKHNGECLALFGIDLKCLEPKWWQRTRVHVSSTIHEVPSEVGRN